LTKLGVFVGENNWIFFKEIFEDLANRYDTEVYGRRTYKIPILYGRLNRWEFHRGINQLLSNNDVCFFEWASELLMVASQLPKQCVMIARLHSFELYEWAPKINWDVVDRVILVSNAMQEMFNELYPENAHKTVVIYNGRSLEEFSPPKQRDFELNIGMLCRITPIKRIYETVMMLYNLRQMGYDARLHIAGEAADDYRYMVAIRRLVEKLNLIKSVTFYGHITDSSTWLRNINIYISNSFWEGQSVALLEAMASGCYCISHFWAGVDEMLPNENIYITESELISKIVQFSNLSDAEKRGSQEKLRSIACEKFNIERTKSEIRQLIETAGANPPSKSISPL
jgi:glycosyltransferase involved in cell wall biosynthesis